MESNRFDVKTVAIIVLVIAVAALGYFLWQEQRTDRLAIEFNDDGIEIETPG